VLRVGVLEGPVCENGNGTVWVGLARVHFKNARKSGVFTFFRGSGTHAHRVVAVVVADAGRRWAGVMEGATGAPSAVNFEAFLALKKPRISSIRVEKRIRNG